MALSVRRKLIESMTGGGLTLRRPRRHWNQAPQVSVRDALLSTTHELSIVSEVSSVCEEETEEQLVAETGPETMKRLPSVAWELQVHDFVPPKPDTTIVSCPNHKPVHSISRRNRNKQRSESNSNKQTKEHITSHEANGRLRGIRSRVRDAPDFKPKQGAIHSSTKNDVKKVLSTSRAREKALKTRREDFAKTIRLLESKCSAFRRSATPEDATAVEEDEACITEVQQAAYDRWEKAVEVARQSLEEVLEAEKVLGFAAEFDQMKTFVSTQGSHWDVCVDRYIDLYKNLQAEYPETAPIKKSKIVRTPMGRRPSPNGATQVRPEVPMHKRSRSTDGRVRIPRAKTSAIPRSSSLRNAPPPRFDPNYILTLGKRFAHSAEMWFLKLIHTMVGIEVPHSVFCREDCYRLMESLSKLQEWLITTKGTTRLDRHEVLLNRLRDTIIRWSSQMFDLPLARTTG